MSNVKVINFMALRKVAAAVSMVLILVAVASLAINKLQFGLDFTGGTLVEVGYDQAPDLVSVRGQLQSAGFDDAVVQNFGSDRDVLVRLGQAFNDKVGEEILAVLQSGSDANIELRRSEYVGAQVGEELTEKGGLGMLLALAIVMLYVAFRFQLKFSVGAVVALAHDVLIVLGVFSVLQLDFDLTVLAAILAVIGYSLNDTIVVSDRIRENFRKLRKGTSIEIINESLSQTLGRTLVTSVTTILVLLALFIFGGELIHGFALALLIGVVVGTYSSIYVASNVLLALGVSQQDLIIPPKEDVIEGEGFEVDMQDFEDENK
ncbi:MAG: protein translocase subunit SecF [Gammaproteobacteria bacterium]|jgi:preprotein translocase subunit SecF|nr:protein translocase subunit SecF [Gammaproteobacteria bacterium]MCP4879201.1 protein translocase subunit SecF [Gammaproteobacteria bacterium]